MELAVKWRVVEVNSSLGKQLRLEDDSIWTDPPDSNDSKEVLGTSEWLRCDIKTLYYIVRLHNIHLDKVRLNAEAHDRIVAANIAAGEGDDAYN